MEVEKIGYRVHGSVAIKADGTNSVRLLVVTNANGRKLFVLVDTPKFYPSKDQELYRLEKSNPELSASVKQQALELVGSEVTGTVLESHTGLTVLTRDEENFALVETYYARSLNPSSGLTEYQQYPLVKLSELTVHPKLLVEITDKLVARIQNERYRQLVLEAELAVKRLAALHTTATELFGALEARGDQVKENIAALERYKHQYTSAPSLSEGDLKKAALIEPTLIQHNLYAGKVIARLNQLLSLVSEISQYQAQLNDFKEQIETDFATVGYITSE